MEAYDKVASVVRSFELGNLVAEPVAVAGGRAHRLWRVQTEGGTFALKALNPQLTGSPAILELIRDKIRLELVCLEAGVRGPEPLSGPDGDYLLQPQADRWWRCHRWVEGGPPRWAPASPDIAAWVGSSLAVTHRYASLREGPTPPPPLIPREQWDFLVTRGSEAGFEWAAQLNDSLDLIAAANRRLRVAAAQANLIRGHGEVDPRNVLLDRQGRPWLVDWDGLNYQHPVAEVVGAALHWSGAGDGDPDLEVLVGVGRAYRQAGGLITDPAIYAGMWFAWQLGAMSISARRALGDELPPVVDGDEDPATILVTKLNVLPDWLDRIDGWAQLLLG